MDLMFLSKTVLLMDLKAVDTRLELLYKYNSSSNMAGMFLQHECLVFTHPAVSALKITHHQTSQH